MENWYYAVDQQQAGPVSREIILAKLDSGELSADDLAWNDSMDEWLEIGKIPRLVTPPFVSSPPAVPVTPSASAGKPPHTGSAVPPVSTAAPAPAAVAAQRNGDASLSPYQTPKTVGQTNVYQHGQARKTNGCAIASVILACISLLSCWFFSSIPGAIFGHLALRQIKRSSPPQPGRRLAIAGLILCHLVNVMTLAAIFFAIGA
ncbi:DUF4190 domain-containing protein [Persicirhabdus sediminis]|uniref:DUF4190 domain-containing protein n=1 Tax=Persicirhabdus sediminis TaxID=454144 RepID=A0A8J7SFS5_9BACT|nr:DUF4190 domain-containing protein [Persicirhabdus sediminis]MBK1789660.1 DUF4190 domain-containing protein [Persicirhabdus sediminis]